MLTALLRTLQQLGDPAFRTPLLRGVLGALLVLGAAAVLAAWLLGALAGGSGWVAGLAAAAGALGTLLLALWLFVPLCIGIASLFLNPVARAVEARHFPGLPPPVGAAWTAQLGFNLGVMTILGFASLLALPVALLAPPLGLVLSWAINTLALGPALFEAMAQRRMTVPAARAARRARSWAVLGTGAVLGALALLPGPNLLTPVLGAAAMTHLLHRAPRAPAAG